MSTDNQDGREALLRARAEIVAIIERYDLCASIVLAGQHQFESTLWLDASWCRAKLEKTEQGQGIRVRSNLVEDYAGDKEAQKRDLEATMSLVSGMTEILARNAFVLYECDKALKGVFPDAKSEPLTRVHQQ